MIPYRYLAGIFYKPFPDIIWKYPPYENTVYLTFDDGPYPPATKPLLENLGELQVPATFFLSGENLFRYRREVGESDYNGHEIGSHFFSHIPALGLNSKKLLKEINLTDELIYLYLKRLPRFFRPPFGIFSRKLFPALQSTSKKAVLWTVMAYDFKWEKNKILDHLHESVCAGDIIVFHDSPKTEPVLPEIIPPFVQFCRERGWRFGIIK
jgi:peptidoglycan/xylan/chitin deacetylase (PgdA/CDA1 family)